MAGNSNNWSVITNLKQNFLQPLKRHIKLEDKGDFFRRFASLKENANLRHRASVQGTCIDLDETNSGGGWTSNGNVMQQASSTSWMQETDLSVEEVERLYSEIVFTTVQAIKLIGYSEQGAGDVLAYIRSSCQISEAKHQEILDGINQSPSPEVTLQLGVIEARNLKAKDAKNLSNPCCFISVPKCMLQKSTIQPLTVCPKWNEKFQIPIEDFENDVLLVEVCHVSIEEYVRDAIQRKHRRPVSIKRICLGRVAIPLHTVPSIAGSERWFPLTGKGGKTRNKGEIKLSLALSVDKKDAQLSLKQRYMQYELCLRSFVEHELRLDQEWRGKLHETADVILRQFAAHRALRPAETDVCLWSIYAVVLRKRMLDFGLVFSLLMRLDKAMDHGKLADEIAEIFRSSAEKFVDGALGAIRHMRSNGVCSENTSNLLSLLQCLEYFAVQRKNEFPNLNGRIEDAIIMGANEWLNHSLRKLPENSAPSSDDLLEQAIQVCTLLQKDLKRFESLRNESFGILKISYFCIVYKHYDAQLFNLCSPLVKEIRETYDKTSDLSEEKAIDMALKIVNEAPRSNASNQDRSDNDSNPELTMGTALFELYLCLRKFHKLSAALPSTARESLKLNGFHQWFTSAVSDWLDIALYKALIRIGKAIALDTFRPIDQLAKYSSSAVDTIAIFYQIKTFCNQLSWPDAAYSMIFAHKIIYDIYRCSLFYTNCVSLKLESSQMTQTEDDFYVDPSVCVGLNNIIHIRQSIEPLANQLVGEYSTLPNDNLNEILANAFDTIDAKLEDAYDSTAQRIASNLEHVINVEMNVGKSPHVDGLVAYLDANLQTVKLRLESGTFERLLALISQRVLHTLHNSICRDIENKRQPAQFALWEDILKVLTNFFYGAESSEVEQKEEVLAKIRHLLRLHASDSSYLMQQYHLERMAQVADDAHLGTVAVRAFFADDKLTVDVLNARNLKRADAKANPYVKIQLIPRDKFPESPTHKTKVQKNTVFPLFDETFTFHVPHEVQSQPDCFVVLTVKDYDLLGANLIIGEALLKFRQVPRVQDVKDGHQVDQIHLPLVNSPNLDSEYLQVLKNRSWDKAAKNFVDRQKKRKYSKDNPPFVPSGANSSA